MGPYRIYFGVQFLGQSGLAHAPDIALAHDSNPGRPILVFECKHYSGKTLPKPVVMAFVGLLCDLRWAVFDGCIKAKRPEPLYPGHSLTAIPSGPYTQFNGDLCRAFGRCKSRLVVTLPPANTAGMLEQRYEFVIDIAKHFDANSP